MTQPLKKIFKYLSATMVMLCFHGTCYAEMYKCQGRGGAVLRSYPCNTDEQTVSIDGVPRSEIEKANALQLRNQQLQEQAERLREKERLLAEKKREAEAKKIQEEYRQKKEYLAEGTLVCSSARAMEEVDKNWRLKDIYIKQEKCFVLPTKVKYQLVGDSIEFCKCRKVLLLPTSAASNAFDVYVQSYLIPD